MALMTLRLWEIANLALPLAAILAVQVGLIALVCFWPTFRLMGRDYDAAVMSSGFCGFMLGTTANAMANMGVLTEKYGPAPRAYLVVPMVGAFFIDFTNADDHHGLPQPLAVGAVRGNRGLLGVS
jgi:ESS family glutamate:Na+ symporter